MPEDDGERPIGHDLIIKSVEPRKVGGIWLQGTVAGHCFQALMFQEHATVPSYEISDSFISKLWIGRLSDRKVVFNWDRGLDTIASDRQTKQIVDFLTGGRLREVFLRLESAEKRELSTQVPPRDERQLGQEKSTAKSDRRDSMDSPVKISKNKGIDRSR